jgi:hypothetical protein
MHLKFNFKPVLANCMHSIQERFGILEKIILLGCIPELHLPGDASGHFPELSLQLSVSFLLEDFLFDFLFAALHVYHFLVFGIIHYFLPFLFLSKLLLESLKLTLVDGCIMLLICLEDQLWLDSSYPHILT